jgi:hypothetical protein
MRAHAFMPVADARQPCNSSVVHRLKSGRDAELQRRDERDAAIRAAQSLYAEGMPYRAAKKLHRDLRDYLSRCWPREKEVEALPPGVAARRSTLHRIAHLSRGKELCWRRIYDILRGNQISDRR